MSAPKQRQVWICLAGGEVSAAFSTEEMANEYCKMQNTAQEQLQLQMRQLGFPNYGRTYFSYVVKDLKRGID